MEENGKKNGKTNGSESADLERIAEENRKMVDEKKNGNGSTKAEATSGKTEKAKASPKKSAVGKKRTADKQKVTPFTAKPVPEAVKGLVVSIQKVTDLENLKAVARALQKHWKGVYFEACKKATEGLKAGNVVWFKKGSKLIEGKVIKIKSNGKVKIDVEGKNWRVPGTLVHKGKPTGANRAEATGSEVTKKAA